MIITFFIILWNLLKQLDYCIVYNLFLNNQTGITFLIMREWKRSMMRISNFKEIAKNDKNHFKLESLFA